MNPLKHILVATDLSPHARNAAERAAYLSNAQQAALDRLLSELCASGIAVVMSSHDLNHTLRHAHRSWLICRGETIACGSTAEVLSEENLTAAYAIDFQRVEVAGHLMLVASQ